MHTPGISPHEREMSPARVRVGVRVKVRVRAGEKCLWAWNVQEKLSEGECLSLEGMPRGNVPHSITQRGTVIE